MIWKMNEGGRMDHLPFPVPKENNSGYSERNIYSYVSRRELKARKIKHFLLIDRLRHDARRNYSRYSYCA